VAKERPVIELHVCREIVTHSKPQGDETPIRHERGAFTIWSRPATYFLNHHWINNGPRRMRVMEVRTRKLSATVAVCALLAPMGGAVLAQRPADQTIAATHGQIAGVAAGAAGAGALIGVGVYYAVKHDHSVTGCARSGPDGLQLTSESDKRTYSLVGAVAAIKTGNRVRVSGKKTRQKSPAPAQFLVEKVTKDLGPCEIASSSR
jgi:hypothetical protein